MSFETISVIGLGYIGLPTAAMFASRKMKVIGVDVVQSTVDTINSGGVHIVEPDLDIVVKSAVEQGYLKAVTTPEPADAFLVAVPTPFKGDHEPDLRYIEAAANSIAPVLKKGDLVVLESTSPVGATEKMTHWMADLRSDLSFPIELSSDADIKVAHCPERVLPGHVMRELIENDRVIGGMSEKCSEAAIELYKTFVTGKCVITNSRTAEMAKLTENSFRDVNIAFANELSIICDKLDINVWELIELSNRHPRVNILQPGPGVGGHCIAVDPWFIVSRSPEDAKLIKTSRLVNDFKPEWVVSKVKESIKSFLNQNTDKNEGDVVIACFGLSFKANIDDLRESPALNICEKLSFLNKGKTLLVEPNISSLPNQFSSCENVKLVSVDYAIGAADIFIGLVDHDEFIKIKAKDFKSSLIIDAKGMW